MACPFIFYISNARANRILIVFRMKYHKYERKFKQAWNVEGSGKPNKKLPTNTAFLFDWNNVFLLYFRVIAFSFQISRPETFEPTRRTSTKRKFEFGRSPIKTSKIEVASVVLVVVAKTQKETALTNCRVLFCFDLIVYSTYIHNICS